MMKLPSRGWGPWRQEFYSFHSNISAMDADISHEFGTWTNVWTRRFGHFVYVRWPDLWRWFINLPPMRRRSIKHLQKFFPNLR